jgi:hypothetical protein
MKQVHLGLLVASVAAVLGLPAAVSANSTLAKSLGNLRWGMSQLEVRTALKGKLKDKAREFDSSFVEFDGSRTRWDSAPVAEEYTHGNEEAMMTFKDSDGSENYYFFIGGELWKWVKLYPAASFGGRDFDKFSKKVEGRFGKGREKEAEVNPGSGYSYKFIEYLDRESRLRAVDKTEGQGQFALVFESMGTVRSLTAMRSSTIRRAVNKKAAVAKAAPREEEADEEAIEAPRAAKGKTPARTNQQSSAFTLAAAKKGSIFSGDSSNGDSNENDYQARKERIQAQEREKQERAHQRAEDSKKGKTLDELAGMDDDDPLAGVK